MTTPVTQRLLRDWPLPGSGGGKESKGRVLIVGGHVSVPGATLLAAEAALRAGAGKLQVACVADLAVPLGVALPEAMVVSLPQTGEGGLADEGAATVVDLAAECDAVLLGPGLTDPDRAASFCQQVVPELRVPLVLDAVGMAYLTQDISGVQHLEGRVVLTPNLDELAVTLGRDEVPADDALEAAAELAQRAEAVVVTGAATTVVATPGGASWTDDAGAAGLGVSGSGDVKAGVVTGLLARGADAAQAAVWGCHAHGRAGERLTSQVARHGFLARELLPVLPGVLAELAG